MPSILGWDEGISHRLKLNELLKRFYRDREILCADLFEETCDPETKRLRADYSSDELHLNASGYRKMAETIYKVIRDLLIRELN